jgi:hypothetical protein
MNNLYIWKHGLKYMCSDLIIGTMGQVLPAYTEMLVLFSLNMGF